ncbi:MAG: MiaB/RimO family radical SAM methylthiotransferase [bacterium]
MRVAFKTFGCRLNQAETEQFAADFTSAGWHVVPPAAPADVVVIHGCAVTHTAEQQGLQMARSIKRTARMAGQQEPFVALVGCVVEADAARRAVAGVDLLVTRDGKDRLAAIVQAHLSARALPAHALPELPDPSIRPRRKRALLKVQDGCDFFCSYCIVPHTRGLPVSRPWQQVLDEARALSQAGFSELVVTGCNMACYRDGTRGLPDLLAALVSIAEVPRLRLGSIEPATSELEIIELMSSCSKICRHLHLPLQSGDAATLRRMRRRYTPESYAAIVQAAMRRLPDLGLGTDLIVGFPGESDESFARTIQFVESLPFSNLHVFPYSARPGTTAAELPEAVPPAVRKARAQELLRLREEKRRAFALQFVGRPVDVLIERLDTDGFGCGWSGAYLDCRVPGISRSQRGRIVRFTPTGVGESGALV